MSHLLRTLLLLTLCYAPTASAQNQIVNTLADGPSDGECAIDCTLREAVALVGVGGTITFAAGLSGQTITLSAGQITLTKNMTVDGSSVAVPVTVSGGDASRAFVVNSGVVATITGLTITDGLATGSDAGYGGAILNYGTLSLADCTVSNSHAPADGGAIYNAGTLILTRSTVSGNTATGYGGGIYLEGPAIVRNSTISGNASNEGAGILSGGSSLQVDNSTISGNTVNLLVTGSAIMQETGTVTVRNSTLVGSQSRVVTVRTGTLNISNTIIYQDIPNASEPCWLLTDSDPTPDPTREGVLGTHSNNLIYAATASPLCSPTFTTDPNLNPLADNGGPTWTHMPGPSSDALDNGDPATCAALPGGNLDQRGLPRAVDLDDASYPDFDAGNPCDIGAVEAQSEAELPVELVSFEATRDGADVVLRWTTASEANNAGFDVEWRHAGVWQALAFVEGRGTTTQAQAYTYRARGLAPGVHRFRLKQVDYDGASHYSPEVEVVTELAEAFALSPVYPNPFNPQATFTLTVGRAQHAEVTVFDALGRPVARLHEGVLEANQTYTFRLEGARLPAGAYQVRAVGESFTATRPAVLLK